MKIRIIKTIVSIILAVILAVVCFQNLKVFFQNPFSKAFYFDYPSFVTTDTGLNKYVIDRSKRRVFKLNNEGQIEFVLNGGSKEQGSFFYAVELAVDPAGNLFILNSVLDRNGFFMEREEILKYDSKGKFIGIIYSINYGEEDHNPAIVQRGQIQTLRYSNNGLSWLLIDGTGIKVFKYLSEGTTVQENPALYMTDANLIVAYARVLETGAVVYTHKNGSVLLQGSEGDPVVLYDGNTNISESGFSIPWSVDALSPDSIYFGDLGRREIVNIINGQEKVVLSDERLISAGYEGESLIYYNLNCSNGVISACNDLYIAGLDEEGNVLYYIGEASLKVSTVVFRFVLWFCALSAVGLIIYALRMVYVHIMKKKLTGIIVRVSGIIMIIAISAVLVSSMIIENFSQRYQKEVLNKIATLCQLIPKVVDPEIIDNLDNQSDFMSEGYKSTRTKLFEALNYNRDEWNNSFYFVLYKIIDGNLYGLMYLNGQIGMFFPFSYLQDGYESYSRAYSGEIATEFSSDSFGSWLYGVGPIKNSDGEVIALVEIGTDLYSFNQENKRLISSIVLDVITMLVIVVLLMIELTFLSDVVKRRENYLSAAVGEKPNYSDILLVRPYAFILFTAISISVVFVPLLMKQLYVPIAGFNENLLFALPISAEMFFFGLATLLAGYLVNKTGWRRLANIGVGLIALGLLFSGLVKDQFLFVLARSLTGFGSGLVLLSLRSFINSENRSELRSAGFSHFYSGTVVGLNIGAVFGGVLADKIGYSNVFFVGLGFLALAVFYSWRFMGSEIIIEKRGSVLRDNDGKQYSVFKFLANPKVIFYFLLIITPTYVASTFLGYYFPLFAESIGISNANIGRLFILNGLFIIYLGPVLSVFLEKYLGVTVSLAASSILWGGAIILFALTGNIPGIVITLIIMGISEGFGVTAQNDYFLAMKASKLLGEDKAISYYELIGKFSETLGPILFGLALLLGSIFGLLAIGIGIVASLVVFILFAKMIRE